MSIFYLPIAVPWWLVNVSASYSICCILSEWNESVRKWKYFMYGDIAVSKNQHLYMNASHVNPFHHVTETLQKSQMIWYNKKWKLLQHSEEVDMWNDPLLYCQMGIAVQVSYQTCRMLAKVLIFFSFSSLRKYFSHSSIFFKSSRLWSKVFQNVWAFRSPSTSIYISIKRRCSAHMCAWKTHTHREELSCLCVQILIALHKRQLIVAINHCNVYRWKKLI